MQTDIYGNITASNAKFVYADHEGGIHKVASPMITSRGASPMITDFQIIEDTVYFCGYVTFYRRDPSHPSRNSYQGFIGYFCIPDLFNERDKFHILPFQNRVPALGRSGYYPSCPTKMKAFAVNNGIHIVCVGKWGTTDSTLGNRFVADIVHNYPTGKWWYYVYPEEGTMMSYSDIAVTDNYVAAIGSKAAALEDIQNREANGYYFYLQLFHKPATTSTTPRGTDTDHQIFKPGDIRPSLCNALFLWANNNYNNLFIYEPHLTHTNGDSLAVSYLTYAKINNQNMYGTTIKHFAIHDILQSFPHTSSGTAPIYSSDSPTNLTSEILTLGNSPQDILAPADSPIITNGTTAPANIYIPERMSRPAYNRMVRNQQDFDSLVIGRTSHFLLKDVIYNREFGQILCLQNQYYTPTYHSSEMSIFAFKIHDPFAPAIQYHRDDLPVLALSEGNQPITFCIASGTSIQDSNNTLTYGQLPLEMQDKSCYRETDRSKTFDCGGFLYFSNYNVLNPQYVSAGYAFMPLISYSASVKYATDNGLCN